MKTLTRREAAAVAAATLAAPITMSRLSAEEPNDDATPAATEDRFDKALAHAVRNPQAFQLRPAGSFQLNSDGRSRSLVIAQALNAHRERDDIYMKSDSMRIFRAEPLEAGGCFKWRFHNEEGLFETNLNSWSRSLGPILMVFREGPDLVRVYVMTPDMRC